MARFLSHHACRTPRPNASSPIVLQIAPQGLNNYSGGMTRSKCVAASHAQRCTANHSNCRKSVGKRLTTLLTAVLKRLGDCGCDPTRCSMVDTDAKTAWQLFH